MCRNPCGGSRRSNTNANAATDTAADKGPCCRRRRHRRYCLFLRGHVQIMQPTRVSAARARVPMPPLSIAAATTNALLYPPPLLPPLFQYVCSCESCSPLEFLLHVQEFLALVRAGGRDAALAYATTHISAPPEADKNTSAEVGELMRCNLMWMTSDSFWCFSCHSLV